MANQADQHISDFMSKEQRELIVWGLQALWRERKTAYNLACDLPQVRAGKLSPSDFGLPEVEHELRAWGAAPQTY